jgi:hypothetical protein
MAVQVKVAGRLVGAVAANRVAEAQDRAAYIHYILNGEQFRAKKLDPVDFSAAHIQTLGSARLSDSRQQLSFDNPAWKSIYLGAGEEKAVFLIIDEEERAFALELLVKGGYLNGRLTEGYYLADLHLSHISGVRRDPKAILSLTYSGEAKVREFIYGATLVEVALGTRRAEANPLFRFISAVAMNWASYVINPRYHQVRRTFKDAHEANVAIELIPLHNPERKSHSLLPIPVVAYDKKLHWYFYRLTPIDVRAMAH